MYSFKSRIWTCSKKRHLILSPNEFLGAQDKELIQVKDCKFHIFRYGYRLVSHSVDRMSKNQTYWSIGRLGTCRLKGHCHSETINMILDAKTLG